MMPPTHIAKRELIRQSYIRKMVYRGASGVPRKRPGGRIFTTNYDLLLCWAVAPDRDIGKNRRFNAYEGFRGGPYEGVGGATIIYLHGALHLARDQWGERQLQYRGTGVALHDQIKAQLERGEYPIFVSEGASSLKEPNAPGFLKDAHGAFQGTCNTQTRRALFTLGHGLGPEDGHILGRIAKGKIPNVYLGAFPECHPRRGLFSTTIRVGEPRPKTVAGHEL